VSGYNKISFIQFIFLWTTKEIDYKRAAEQLRNGEPLFGKDGALAPMLELILDAALEGEMDAHLSLDERSKGNGLVVSYKSV